MAAGPDSARYLLTVLNTARDVREHFACICLDLHRLGRRDYPYDAWADLLIELYLTPRYDPNQPAPYQDKIADRIPANWGLFVRSAPDGQRWLAVPNYDPARWDEPADTSHANRVAWLAAKAYAEGLIGPDVIDGLVNTLRYQIWTPEKGPFYFTNYADGSDGEMNGLSSGRGGNIWFGWHRLASYDDGLKTLFLDMAYDLTTGGRNLPTGAQNKSMLNAKTCLEAWAARLIEMYLTPRYDVNQPAPWQDEIPTLMPANWGLLARSTPDSQTWFFIPNNDPARWSEPADTSHANRTAWLAARAYAEGFIGPDVMEGLVNTFRYQIWTPENGPFYFTNYADGNDVDIDGLSSGRGGTVWFGWHRLAAHDDGLRTLFLNLAYDLTGGGPNLPPGAQNKSMLNAKTCLEAWAARLIADEGWPCIFP